ncbi:hypothetical protein ABIG06_006296 [Bradyrhizobium sp. USDA 326]
MDSNYSIDPMGNDGGEVDGSQEAPGELVVVSCDTPEAAETALDDVAPFIGAFAEV